MERRQSNAERAAAQGWDIPQSDAGGVDNRKGDIGQTLSTVCAGGTVNRETRGKTAGKYAPVDRL